MQRHRLALVVAFAALSSCGRGPDDAVPTAKGAPVASPGHPSAAPAKPPPGAAPALAPAPVYPWLAGKSPSSTLLDRFPAPKGATRVAVAAGSFGHFLRTLPLAPPGTPVLSYAGGIVRAGDHAHVAAVADLDVGTHDLQQCADSVVRLHAEWLWSRGRTDAHYKTGSGLVLSFDRYLAGERLRVEGGSASLAMIASKKPASHALYRAWLDDVFGWANTGSLAKEATPVALADLSPGDFFVMPGAPFGHAVLVLDVAQGSGKRFLLLGQGFMPAQSFHVLSDGGAWFPIDEASGAITTPFWKPFPFSSLRRLGA